MTALTEKQIVNDSQGTEYQVYNGTAYHVDTPDEVIAILDRALNSHRDYRIRLFYGDTETGLDWLEQYDTTGYVGRSTGSVKIPLLIPRSDSIGGASILDNCIVKITINKRTVYQHKNYHLPELEIKLRRGWQNRIGNEYTVSDVAAFKTRKAAENWILFMHGDRNRA